MSYPKELLDRKQWVNWRLIPDKDGGKDKKMPYNPITGKGAQSNNPATWTDYATAADALERYGFTGLGFMFSKEDDIVGVDVDHCYDPETKTFNETAKAIIARQPTYMEFSPSGTGIHLFFKGAMPGTGNKNTKTGVEMYEHTRYFTMTGKRLDGATDIIAEDNGTLKWIHETYIRTPKKQQQRKSKKSASVQLSDDDLLELARGADNGEAFSKLWGGDWQDAYSSQSEADMALCCRLAFWSGKDKAQMDRLFRQSGLFRDKWDTKHHASGATYGEETLDKACELTEDTYAPGNDAPVFEYKGMYFRSKGDNIYPITNFVFVPVEMIVAEEETQLTADLVTVRGETYRLTFMTTDFANQQKFKNALNKRTIALSYTGSDGDLELLKAYISELEWKTKLGVKAMGIYEHGSGMAFVSVDGAVDENGASVEDIIQLDKYSSICSDILDAKLITATQLQRLGEVLMSYNEPAKAVSILAWIGGCFVKEHLRKKNVKYPHLMLIGEAGSGKSNTLERVIMPVFSRSKIVAAGQTTAFTLMKDSASSNTIPMALDEFKPSKIDSYRLAPLLNHFRNSYDGQEGIRGRADQTTVSYELLAPLVVAGEESPDEAAIRERSIELLFSKKDLKTVEYRAAFQRLCASADLLGCLGHSLLNIALKTKPAECYSWYDEALGGFNKELPSRVVNNLACMVAGLRLMEKLCSSLGLLWHETFPYALAPCTKYIEYAAKEYLLDGGTSNKSVVEQTLEVTKLGDLWTLGRHRLVCGDSTKAETFAVLMDDRKANLVITDPPYNVNYEGSAGKIKNDNMGNDAFYHFLLDAFTNTEAVMAEDASIYVFHADTEGLNFRRAFSDAGFYLSGCCIWKKQSLVLGRSPYQWQHEPVLYGWKKTGKHQWYSGRKETTIWEFDKPKKNGDHPTMKPIPLLAYPIMNSSMTNTLVLDPFGGSGSTLIACEQADRSCATIELDEKFCDVIVKRYIEQVGAADKVSVQRDGLTYSYTEVAVKSD